MYKCDTVAFILHPLNVNEFKEKAYFYKPFDFIVSVIIKCFSLNIIKSFYSSLLPHQIFNEKCINIRNTKGKFNLVGIMCPVFPEEIIRNKVKSYKKIKNAIRLAKKRGADVVVLTGFTSMISEFDCDLKCEKEFLNLTITSGNALTAILSIEGIEAIIKRFGLNMKSLTISIIGATGDIGKLTVKLIRDKFRKVILCSRNIENWSNVENILNKNTIYEKTKDINYAARNGDVVLLATSSYIPLINGSELKHNAIVCDVSLPHNVQNDVKDERRDVFIFDGGISRIDFESVSKKFEIFLKQNRVYGCIAEGILLCCKNIKSKIYLRTLDMSDDDLNALIKGKDEYNIKLSEFYFHGTLAENV